MQRRHRAKAAETHRFGLPQLHVGGCEVVVGIAKPRLQLNGFQIKLNGRFHIPQLFQGIAQVAIGFGKVGVNANGLLVVENALGKVAQLEMQGTQQQQVVRAVSIGLINLLASEQRLLIAARIVLLVC